MFFKKSNSILLEIEKNIEKNNTKNQPIHIDLFRKIVILIPVLLNCVVYPYIPTMKFVLLDQITEITPGQSIRAVKNLTLSEEYLHDHFPGFPVMPGVLMLEAMIQLSAWLIRVTDDFAHPIITLKEARNVKYGHFVQPGEKLELEGRILKREGNLTKLAIQGNLNGEAIISARLTMESSDLDPSNPQMVFKQKQINADYREMYVLLTQNTLNKKQ